MKTTLIIPAAGEGQRFKDAGYSMPKPLIKMPNGLTMIHNAVNAFRGIPIDDIFLLLPSSIAQHDSFLRGIWKNGLSVDEKTEGPACTVLTAKRVIDNNPLIIANCDQYVGDFDLEHLNTFAEIHDADVVLGCFLSTSPKNSYVRVDDAGQITEVREKEVISNIATNGLHWFRRGTDFVRAAEKMIEADDRVNGEFYIAPSVNYLIAEGMKVMPFFFNLHFPIGTPEDLQKYEALYDKA